MFKTKFILKVIKSDKDCGCGGENANDAVRREAAGPGGLTFRLFYGAYSKMILRVSLIGVSEILSSVLTIEMMLCSRHCVYTVREGNIHIDTPGPENLKRQNS